MAVRVNNMEHVLVRKGNMEKTLDRGVLLAMNGKKHTLANHGLLLVSSNTHRNTHLNTGTILEVYQGVIDMNTKDKKTNIMTSLKHHEKGKIRLIEDGFTKLAKTLISRVEGNRHSLSLCKSSKESKDESS